MRMFSVEQKIEMLQYANNHGLTNAMNHYNIDTATLQKWNETLKVYKKNDVIHTNTTNKLPVRISDEFKIRVLEYARDNGPSAAARTYNIAPSTIRLWNKEFNIYPTRTHRTFPPEQRAKIIAYANMYSIADAAREFKVAGFQIQDWINKQAQK
jgi:transposase-like protein